MGFSLLCSGKNAFSSETFAFFETAKSFSGARNISVHARAVGSVLANVVKTEWLVRFSDDFKERPRELSAVTRIIGHGLKMTYQ